MTRYRALLLSVLHYGLANLNSSSKPAKTETVLDGARTFEKYLDGGDPPPKPETSPARHSAVPKPPPARP